MILVDTSVWIDHLHRAEPRLVQALLDSEVGSHPGVIGELALGSLKHRAEVLGHLRNLPALAEVEPDEVLWMIDRHALFGRGLAWVDVNLLASVLVTPGWAVWTRDKRLIAAATEMGVGVLGP